MSEQGSTGDRAGGTGRSPSSSSSPSAAPRRVAGSRRPATTPAAVEPTAPLWLMRLAGVSWRLLVVVAAVALIFYATSRVLLLFVAVFLALVFTAVLRPAVEFLTRVMPRALATGLALLGGVLAFLGLLTYVGVSVAGQWSKLSEQFGQGIQDIIDFLEHGSPFTVTVDQINQWIENGRTWVEEHGGELASQAVARAGSVVEVLTALALAIFCTIFFLASGRQMWTWFLNQLPASVRDSWSAAGGAGWYAFSGYTRGILIIAVTDGLLAFILLTVLGVPLAAPLAVLVLIGAFIPLIGAPVAMFIAMIVALAANGPVQAAIVGIGIALIGQFEGHVLQPLVMGKQVSLHPVVIALAVAGGTLTAGILGAVIAVPLIAVTWTVFSTLRTPDPSPTDEADVPSGVEAFEAGEAGEAAPQ